MTSHAHGVLMAMAAGALTASLGLAASQDFGGRQGEGGRQGGRGGPQMTSPILTALDRNRDATISAAETDAAPTTLKTLDRNNDGWIAGEELMPAFGRGGREGGVLSADEIANAPASLRALNTNNDGQLTPDEYRNAGPGRGETLNSGNDNNERNC